MPVRSQYDGLQAYRPATQGLFHADRQRVDQLFFATIGLPDHFEVGEPLTGGPPDPTVLASAARRGGRTGGAGATKGRTGGTRAGGTRSRRAAKPAA